MDFLGGKLIDVLQNLMIRCLGFLNSHEECGLDLDLGRVCTVVVIVQAETLNCLEHPLARNQQLAQHF